MAKRFYSHWCVTGFAFPDTSGNWGLADLCDAPSRGFGANVEVVLRLVRGVDKVSASGERHKYFFRWRSRWCIEYKQCKLCQANFGNAITQSLQQRIRTLGIRSALQPLEFNILKNLSVSICTFLEKSEWDIQTKRMRRTRWNKKSI